MPLRFIGMQSWLQWDDNEANRTAIPAMRTSEGTHPAGSQWTRNPIPACGDFEGGGLSENGVLGLPGHCKGAQFKPPLPGVYGFYGQTPNDKIHTPHGRRALTHWNVIDKLQVPTASELLGLGGAGEYVLGFRIDAEQTPQVWQQCASITITV